jgi:hypothetical protein
MSMIKESFDFLINCRPLTKYSVIRSMVNQTCPTHPTGESLHVFKQLAWLGVGSGKIALSRLAYPRVTHTVRLCKIG